jgi:hypothetical protein
VIAAKPKRARGHASLDGRIDDCSSHEVLALDLPCGLLEQCWATLIVVTADVGANRWAIETGLPAAVEIAVAAPHGRSPAATPRARSAQSHGDRTGVATVVIH